MGIEVAKQYLQQHYPHATAALLGGSAVHGQFHERSDLDLVIIDPETDVSFHEVVHFKGWTIDTFVFYEEVISDFFALNADRGIPTLQKICATGVVLCNVDGAADTLKAEAVKSYTRGPTAWTLDELNDARYQLTDVLLDLEATTVWMESWVLSSRLIWQTIEFALRAEERWCGEGRWLLREFKAADEIRYIQLTQAIEVFEAMQQTQPIIDWVDSVLEPYGGRLLLGYYAEGEPD